jgi:outer membrane protein assembly factor BamE (lipoprotein component of BamABCDE complex)
MKIKTLCTSCLLALASMACQPASKHSEQLHSSKEKELTLGIVQKEIRKGMSAADVAIVLGSPNIVTRDKEGLETWVYDKIATEVSYSKDSGGVSPGIGAAGSSVVGLILGNYSKQSGATASTQKTLTIVIKFNEDQEVNTFSTHSSRF